MSSEKIWYSPIFKLHNYGFFAKKHSNKCFLGYKHTNGKEVTVKISFDTFNVLKKEWR